MPGSVRNVIDPFIFIDPTDSTVWMSYRHQDGQNLGFVQMNDSATKITGNINNCVQNVGNAPSGYREGSWMWKRGDMYYLVFAQVPGSGNEIIAYSTATNRMGPWTYRGQIFGQNNTPSEFTIHAGACEFKGQSYIFYHNVTFGGQIFGSERCSGIEYLTYNSDGTINTSRISKTNRGVGIPNAYNDTIQIDRGIISGAVSAAWPYNANTTEAKASWYITNITNNAKVQYDSVDFTPPEGYEGPAGLMVRVAGTSSGGTIEVRTGSFSGTLLGSVSLKSTGSKTSWETQSGELMAKTSGKHNLFFTFTTPSGNTYDVNWVKFVCRPVVKTAATKAAAGNGISWKRTGRTRFTVNVTACGGESKVRLFNMAGQEIENAVTVSAGEKGLIVKIKPEALVCGNYMLSVKTTDAAELRIPFLY